MSTQFIFKENLTIPQGVDFTYVVTILDRDGDALNLSGISSITSAMRTSYYTTAATSLDVSIISAAAGTIAVGISAAVSSPLDPKNYLYDILGTYTSNSHQVRLIQGMINLTPKVT